MAGATSSFAAGSTKQVSKPSLSTAKEGTAKHEMSESASTQMKEAAAKAKTKKSTTTKSSKSKKSTTKSIKSKKSGK